MTLAYGMDRRSCVARLKSAKILRHHCPQRSGLSRSGCIWCLSLLPAIALVSFRADASAWLYAPARGDHASQGRSSSPSAEGRGSVGRRTGAVIAGLIGSMPSGQAAFAEEDVPAPPPPTKVGGEDVVLANGLNFPAASFGLQVYSDATAELLTKVSLEVGYRNFFSSVLANNQVGFAKAVAAAGVPRSELFICGSVLSNEARSFDTAYKLTKRGCEENLRAFAVGGITYVDMIMLDYPARNCAAIKGQWRAFEEMLAENKTKSLAVSNFSPEQLDCILEDKDATPPLVNQVLYGVGYGYGNVVAENKKRGVVVQAWSPLGNLYGSPFGGAAKPACEKIGLRYGKSAAQVALRWIVQTGATFTTQSRKREHFVEDLNIFDFSLTDDEMKQLSALRA